MNPLLLTAVLLAASPIRFQAHEIDAFPKGYQVAVADLNGDGKPDVIALSTDADRVDWYENPTWRRRPVARTDKNIALAVHDIDGDGKPDIALASGFYFADPARGGEIQWLKPGADPERPWTLHPIAKDPVTHRLLWADLDGDGRAELLHAGVLGPGSNGAKDPKPTHLYAYRVPAKPAADPWPLWKIDESLTILHGLWTGDLDGDGRAEILTASYDGIWRFDFEGSASSGSWRKVQIAAGAPPVKPEKNASRGSSEVAVGHLDKQHVFIASIDPWHGNQVVIYRPGAAGALWTRQVLDNAMTEGHGLVVADFDGDGRDEIVAGWRGAGGGLRLYRAADPDGRKFDVMDVDLQVPVEGLVAADINGDGRLDLVANAGRKNRLVWYENLGPTP